jgi:ApbE superfamily uncharacterized protein (UPF0280 family)
MMPSLPRIKKHITLYESDITIITDSEKYVTFALDTFTEARIHLETVIQTYPEFKSSFSPYYTNDNSDLIQRMEKAGELANVGPMAAVAGVFADIMSEEMILNGAKIAVVENGGEIMIHSIEDIYIGLYSQTTEIQDKIGFRFRGGSKPLGVATSSGTFGHAISLGKADTVTVFATNAGIADAAATSITNLIQREGAECKLEPALKRAQLLEGVYGVFITCGDKVAKTGTIPEFVLSR